MSSCAAYKNSFFNIAATGSKESSDCCFRKRSYDFIEPIEISPRVLHFGRDDIFWECQGTVANESYPEKIPVQSKPNMPEDSYDKSSWGRSLEHF
jgi:hypothetical protein